MLEEVIRGPQDPAGESEGLSLPMQTDLLPSQPLLAPQDAKDPPSGPQLHARRADAAGDDLAAIAFWCLYLTWALSAQAGARICIHRPTWVLHSKVLHGEMQSCAAELPLG